MTAYEYISIALIVTGLAITAASYLHAMATAKAQRQPRYKGI